jgi:hypothetical protein
MSNIKYQASLTKEFLESLLEKYSNPFQISKFLGIPNKTIIEYFDKFEIERKKSCYHSFD